ncbi:unnamed protein product [Vitrella brassicaformis CCMP3155]|uniref:Uncharacterized protein n=1 Tax=Vitrella brassicaformis (strain CCMP3155) TaxID=1169540 RepID=A0A0G4FW99_VITBC|nr:unnamed protein product [Vitrella brassicaformis CCMP3155]|eukprot:CEM19393.1 unnamed protein product [Vitrella brassicaformis CCMP3155]
MGGHSTPRPQQQVALTSEERYLEAGESEIAAALLEGLGFVDWGGRRKAARAARREMAWELTREIPTRCPEADVDGWPATVRLHRHHRRAAKRRADEQAAATEAPPTEEPQAGPSQQKEVEEEEKKKKVVEKPPRVCNFEGLAHLVDKYKDVPYYPPAPPTLPPASTWKVGIKTALTPRAAEVLKREQAYQWYIINRACKKEWRRKAIHVHWASPTSSKNKPLADCVDRVNNGEAGWFSIALTCLDVADPESDPDDGPQTVEDFVESMRDYFEVRRFPRDAEKDIITAPRGAFRDPIEAAKTIVFHHLLIAADPLQRATAFAEAAEEMPTGLVESRPIKIEKEGPMRLRAERGGWKHEHFYVRLTDASASRWVWMTVWCVVDTASNQAEDRLDPEGGGGPQEGAGVRVVHHQPACKQKWRIDAIRRACKEQWPNHYKFPHERTEEENKPCGAWL